MDGYQFNIIKFLIISALGAGISILAAVPLINLLYRIKFWKKKAREKTMTGEKADVFYSLHKEKEISTPRGGGILIWGSVTILIFSLFLLSQFIKVPWIKGLNFLSRSQTWLPLFTLIVGSIVGLADDILQVFTRGRYVGGGMSFWRRLAIVILIGLIGGAWFYFKLEKDTIHVPLVGDFKIGILYLPLFVVVMLSCWSGGVIDGLDGLSGGIFAAIFGSFSIIALSQGKVDLAVFCGAIIGSLFTFLWFNIPPARFYMGETGILGLTSTMAVVSFLTDSILVLPIIAGILVIEVSSVILQLLSKKFRKKKIWLCTPIHHHFEAKDWPSHKVTMRFWILGVVMAIIGTAIRLIG